MNDTNETTAPPKLGAIGSALLAAQQAIGGVRRDASNKHHGYDYVSAEAMISESRAALHGAGLLFFVGSWCFEPAVPGGKAVGRVCVRYNLCHATSGETLELWSSTPVVPGQGRPDDKAELAALTTNLGYMLRGLLLLPRGEFEIDQRNDNGGGNEQPQRHPTTDYEVGAGYAGEGRGAVPPLDLPPPGVGPGVNDIRAEIDRLYAAGDLAALSEIPKQCTHLLPIERDEVIKHFNPRKIALQRAARGEGAPS